MGDKLTSCSMHRVKRGSRRSWLQNQMQAPRMAGAGKAAHGSRAAEKENAMMAANGTRPRHATVGDDFAASMKKVGRMGFS